MSLVPQWFVIDVNPYPWKVPPFSVGRGKAGKMFVAAGRDEGLHSYKEAIREQLESAHPENIEGEVAISFWFWRNVPRYTTQAGKVARKHDADTTNLQKATEDAFQGYLFDNDKDVAHIQSTRMAQGEGVFPLLVACVWPWVKQPTVWPDAVQFQINELLMRYPLVTGPTLSEGPVPF